MLALISGATSGIGKELAIQLANRNYDLIIIGRRIELLKEIKDAYPNQSIKTFQVDLTDKENTQVFLNSIEKEDIDLWINNAGFGKAGYSNLIDTDQELNMIDLNIKSLHKLTKFAIKHMKKGKIVNISSLASYLPTPKLASYAASKAYVTSYSQALDYELKKQNIPIRVLTVSPGPVKTEFAKTAGTKQKMKGMDVKKCVKIILKGIDKNKKVIVPGFKMKFLKLLVPFIPKALLLKSSHNIQSKK